MTGLIKKIVLGTTLAASTLAVAAPADAQRYGGYRNHRGGDAAAAAIVGGIIGLGVGAAVASNSRDRYYDRGYYYDAPPRVVYRERYYQAPPRRYYNRERQYRGYPRGYYNNGYNGNGYNGYYGY